MTFFAGFQPGDIAAVSLPERFFSEVLPHLADVVELKIILYTFWRQAKADGPWFGLQRDDFSNDRLFMSGLAKDERYAQAALDIGLRDCIAHGILLDVSIEQAEGAHTIYFLNSDRGRAAREAIQQGKWRPQDLPAGIPLNIEKPNIFRLYEENIGVLTPMIADMLRDAEIAYPIQWIEDAMQIAVAKNARNWRYIEAILRRWKENGPDLPEGGDRDRHKYVEGKYAEFIDH
jgi:DNA replication protein